MKILSLFGRAAIHAALFHGKQLYVFQRQEWKIASKTAQARAVRDAADSDANLTGYGTVGVSNEQHCAGCWHERSTGVSS